MKTEENEGRLSRWSRLKREARQETAIKPQSEDLDYQAESAQLPDAMAIDDSEQPLPEAEPPVLTDDDMPPIDTLNSESDFSMFMSSGVTDKLRNLALKQLFKAPQFNLRDGLDEYDDDYTFFEKLGDTVTCDMKHQIEMEAIKKERVKAEAEEAAKKQEALIEQAPDETIEDELDSDDTDGDAPESDLSAQEVEITDAGQVELAPQASDQIVDHSVDQAVHQPIDHDTIKIETSNGSAIIEGKAK